MINFYKERSVIVQRSKKFMHKHAYERVRHKNVNKTYRRKYGLYEDACMVFNNLSVKYNKEEFKQSISLMKEHLDEVSTPVQLKKYL